jgi:hypothetical protein
VDLTAVLDEGTKEDLRSEDERSLVTWQDIATWYESAMAEIEAAPDDPQTDPHQRRWGPP